MSVEQEEISKGISRRKFVKGLGITGILFLGGLEWYIAEKREEVCSQLDEQREKTGGYRIHIVTKDGRIVELLDSGESECMDIGYGYKYIGKETLKRALRKIDDDDGCQIGNIEVWEEEGLILMHTRGLVLSGVNCGDEEYTGKYRSE